MEYTRETLIKRLGEYVGILPSELHDIACEAVELLERFECSKGNCGDLNSEWISCSERLPNEDGQYLVFYEGIGIIGKWIEIMWYGEPSMPNVDVSGKHFYRSDSEWGDIIYDEVIAWMPLPKPYKGGEDE